MQYLRVTWKNFDVNSPILLYSELDDHRWEKRKVEIFRSGRPGFAGQTDSARDTMLGLEPIPALSEIASDPQFEPIEISAAEFERVWAEATFGSQ